MIVVHIVSYYVIHSRDLYVNIMLLELIKDRNVAVVGPSSSLDNKKMGELIDSNDIVIKINKFQNLSPIDFGSKTDILFYNFYKSIPDASIYNRSCKLIVGGHSFTKYKNNRIKLEKSRKIYKQIPHEYYPEGELSIHMRNIINAYCWKTTGFWVICLLFDKIDIIKQLSIFGIDFCFNKYSSKYTTINSNEGHDMIKELHLFKELFQRYKGNKKIIFYDFNYLKYLNN